MSKIRENKIVAAYKEALIRRYDGDEAVFYYSHTDFENLSAKPFTFTSKRGHTLVGAFYCYGERQYDRLIVFDHGLGAGHTAYMKEIERLCRAGYTVFSYDKSGCMKSEGESVYAFSQSISDLDDALKAIKAIPLYQSARISVIGHSFGGYATVNIPAYHPDIESIVALAAPISAKAMLKSFFPGPLSLFTPSVMAFERTINPDFADASALDALRDYRGKALIVHSNDDPTVKTRHHFDRLQKALKARDNITFIRLSGKYHNPNYTERAVRYLGEFSAALTEKNRSRAFLCDEDRHAFRDSFDFDRMTEQDEAVWQKILRFLA